MKKRLLLIILTVLIITAGWNAPLTYHVGVGGVVYEKKIPLYAKACGFLYRDWMYKDIVRGIVEGKNTDDGKAIAILRWTAANIRRGVHAGFNVMDDHPLNIIIRQYGADDQLEDVFTILCSYAGMYGGMEKCYNEQKTKFVILSFIKVGGGRWLIFDVSKNRYFLNISGRIASVDDYLSGKLLLSADDKRDYGEFLGYIKMINFSAFTRAWEQMPLWRIPAEFKKILIQNRR